MVNKDKAVHRRPFRVVAGVDWSGDSLAGVRHIAALYTPDELVLVHALHSTLNGPRMQNDTSGSSLHLHAGRQQELSMAAASRSLRWVSTLIRKNILSTREICDAGAPTSVVPEAARAVGAALIVLGQRGARENFDRTIGSVSHRICLNAGCSTLVVRKPFRSPMRVLALVQEAEDVVALERWLRAFPFKAAAELTVLCLLPRSQRGEPIGPLSVRFWKNTAVSNARSFLNGMVHSLNGPLLRVTGGALRGNPSTIVLQEGLNFDLLMLHGSDRKNRYAGRSGLPWRTLLRLAPCSTLIVRTSSERAGRSVPYLPSRPKMQGSASSWIGPAS
jgi:nucleotide-binding universal stress UspA family protein